MLLLFSAAATTFATDGSDTAAVASTGTAVLDAVTSGSATVAVASTGATGVDILVDGSGSADVAASGLAGLEVSTDGLASADVAALVGAVSEDELATGVSIVSVSATEFAIVRYGMLATAGPVPRATLATF